MFLSNATGDDAIKISGSGHTIGGAMIATNGELKVTGNSSWLGCHIIVDTAAISGSGHRIGSDDCLPPP